VQSAAQLGGKNVTLLASMTPEGMGPWKAVVGSGTRAAFEAYVERVLAPEPSPGRVVVDNLSAHKGGKVCELIEGTAARPNCYDRRFRHVYADSGSLANIRGG
jgi:hypothetical protein